MWQWPQRNANQLQMVLAYKNTADIFSSANLSVHAHACYMLVHKQINTIMNPKMNKN